jgi:hypothetical protein
LEEVSSKQTSLHLVDYVAVALRQEAARNFRTISGECSLLVIEALTQRGRPPVAPAKLEPPPATTHPPKTRSARRPRVAAHG